MKVIKSFFCIQEHKTYKIGDEYTGKRKDLSQYFEAPKKEEAPKKKPVKKSK